jgi:diguanylate cyclase (GGDEF)-like protein
LIAKPIESRAFADNQASLTTAVDARKTSAQTLLENEMPSPMKTELAAKWRTLMGVPRDNPKLLQAQYRVLSRQIPLMYFILLVNSWALAWTHYSQAPAWLSLTVPVILSLVCIVRSWVWRQRQSRPMPEPQVIYQALTRTSRLTGFISGGFALWALALFPYGGAYEQAHVAFYMGITVIGCIFCLMQLRSAALMTAAVVNLVFVSFFASTHIPTFVATAVNVVLVTVAMLVILQNHYGDFTRLVNAQAETEKLSDENLRLANQDSLTGLPNRRQFFTALDDALTQACGTGQRLAVGILDLDGFKPVNDVYGHSVGDRLLVQVGQRLLASVEPGMQVARLGGDEFALIFTHVRDDEQLQAFGERICAELKKPFTLIDVPVQISASLGIATYPDLASSAANVYEYADYALYQSKRNHPGVMSLFCATHHQQLQRDTLTEQALRRAQLDWEFSVQFQPIVDLHSGQTVAFEALARWTSPDLGNVPPNQFIPIAERIGFINRLTLPLLRKALRAAQQWPARVRLSFNLSAHDCGSQENVQRIVDTILASGFDPAQLDLEITETAVMQDIVQVQRAIGLFREMGCGVSLDDFGTGYSSLSQLHALALTKLKVDRSFVTGIHEKPASYKIVKSLVALSQDMGLDCIIEGVETTEEMNALLSLGCRTVQGYLFSKPMPFAQTLEWLEKNHSPLPL